MSPWRWISRATGPTAKRLPDGGPEQDDEHKFRNFAESEANQMWTYHAVAAVVRGHSLLASRPEVDSSRIGITGISWGGYLTCIVAGIDDRLKVAVPVYGCGFLHEDSAWLPTIRQDDDRSAGSLGRSVRPLALPPGSTLPDSLRQWHERLRLSRSTAIRSRTGSFPVPSTFA